MREKETSEGDKKLEKNIVVEKEVEKISQG